jgi:hypothetical protein
VLVREEFLFGKAVTIPAGGTGSRRLGTLRTLREAGLDGGVALVRFSANVAAHASGRRRVGQPAAAKESWLPIGGLPLVRPPRNFSSLHWFPAAACAGHCHPIP